MRRDRRARTDVLLVCAGGGHLFQLWSLRTAWAGLSSAWVVAALDASDSSSLLRGERVHVARWATARSATGFVRTTLLAVRMLLRLRPRVLITTGSAVAVPFAWLGHLSGVQIVFVESLARTETPSLTCRLVAPVADRVFVQWPELADIVPGARYAGTVFADR